MAGSNIELRAAIQRSIEHYGSQAGVVVLRVTLEELARAGFDVGAILSGTVDAGAERLGPIIMREFAKMLRRRLGNGGKSR